LCPTGHVISFAWNEFEEGGWICPNIGADGNPDTTRVASFRAVVEALKASGGEAGSLSGGENDEREIALAIASCDESFFVFAAKLAKDFSGHEKAELESRLEWAKRLRSSVAAYANASTPDERLLALRGARKLAAFSDDLRRMCMAKTSDAEVESILNRHDYFTDAALAAADIEGLDGEIAFALAGCDKAFEDAATLAASLSGHDRLAVESRLEMAKRLKNYVSARASAQARDDLILAWQGAKELESFFVYFRLERERHEKNARLPVPKVFDVRDFGARGDGTGDDGPAFVAAVEAARACGGVPTVVNIPEGTYRIAPDPRYPMKDFTCRDMQTAVSRGTVHPYSGERIDAHLVLKDLDNLTIRGAGMGKTILIFTDSSRGAIRACGCRQVFFEDFSVDLETNPSTQGAVEKVEEEPFALVVRIDEGFPAPDIPLFMDATSRYFSPVDGNGSYLPSGVARMGPTVERVGERLFRIAPYARHLDNPVWRARKAGDRIVMLARYAEGRSGAPRFLLSAFCGAKNIDVRDSAGQVFTATSCYAPSFIGCRAVGRGDADIVTANADSMLAAGIIGPYVSDCVFRGLEDDGINIGTNTGELSTVPKDGRYHHPGPGGGAHPHVGIFLADGVDGRIKMFARLGPDGASTRPLPDNAIPSDALAVPSAKETRITGYMELQAKRTLRPDRVIRVPGTVGAVVRNCEFSRLRGRGIQVHCANMLIESVKVSDVTGCGISAHGLISWGMCFNLHNILVRDCSFTNLGETGARVSPAFLVQGDAPKHRMQFGIEFDRCLFEPGGGHSAAVVGNTDDVLFKDCMMVGNFSSGPVKVIESATNVRVDGCTVGKVATSGEESFLKCEKSGPVRDGIWNFPEPRPEVKTLRTTACALGLDMLRKGALTWLRSCATGQEFAASDGSSLFALSFKKLSDPSAELRVLTAADAADFSFEAAPREIRLIYSGFPDCAAKIVCTVSTRRGDNKIYWDVVTEVADGWALVSSDYPVLALKTSPDISSPFACGHCQQSLFLMAAVEDAPGEAKTFRATSANGATHWSFSRTGLQSGIAKQDYKVVIAVLDGMSGKAPDWRDAAEIFREWPLEGGGYPFKVTSKAADGSSSSPEQPLKVVFLGNSINGTPPSKRWDGNWGMTASWPFRDYVAQTVKGLEDLSGRRVNWRRRNLSQWERNLATWDINERLADLVAFKPDIVVIALGENVPSLKTQSSQALYREKLTELARLFKDTGANIVIRSPFWRLAHHREICEAVAHEVGAAYADLKGCGSDDPSLLALGSTSDDAVAGHPGDKGMSKIAEVVLKAITDADVLSTIP
jgi:hypothetical protein